MIEKIEQVLAAIEDEYCVRVLYACESGSRAWGFESSDSDFDVRFIYVHRSDWYLSIDSDTKRDVIERFDGLLDVGGWDARKALTLFRKSNPPLLEWLGSPIVYRDSGSLAAELRRLRGRYCSPKACAHHYLHMARGNYREYLKGEEVRLKKYLYVLRPLLAIRWIERGLGVVPTQFSVLVERLTSGRLRDAIEGLVARKKRGLEADRVPAIEEIGSFLESELLRLNETDLSSAVPQAPLGPLNALFRKVLAEAWQEQKP